jgi:hypothetical protein
MFAVEIYAAIRRFVFVEGKSRCEAARVFGLSRETIAKMHRYSVPPGYARSKAPISRAIARAARADDAESPGASPALASVTFIHNSRGPVRQTRMENE